MSLQTLPVVLYLSSLRFCLDSGALGTTREVSIGATSTCPGIHVRPSTTTVATTAKHDLKIRICAPLSDLRNTKGHTAGSCHALPDSLPSSTSSQALGAHFLTIRANHFSTPHFLRRKCRAAICRALGDATLPAAFRTLR